MRVSGCFLLMGAVLMSLCSPAAEAAVKITLIGDSTVADHATNTTLRGWGQVLAEQFRPGTVTLVNKAVAGQSSKSFINNTHWSAALATGPEYVLMQFGHNDNATGDFAKSTDLRTFAAAVPDPIVAPLTARDYYRNNMTKYVNDTRARGAVPIILLPMERRVYDANGLIKRFNEPYADAAYDVATLLDVDVIDLHGASIALYEAEGAAATNYLHAVNGTDQSHFSLAGARTYARWVADGLRENDSPLATLLVPEPTVAPLLLGMTAAGTLRRRRRAIAAG